MSRGSMIGTGHQQPDLRRRQTVKRKQKEAGSDRKRPLESNAVTGGESENQSSHRLEYKE